MNEAIKDILCLYSINTFLGAYQATLQVEELLFTNTAPPSQIFAKPVNPPVTSLVSKVTKPAPPPFARKCFSCDKYDHRGVDCPDKKTTLLASALPEDDEIADKIAGFAFLEALPELHAHPEFDYGDECYEIPPPTADISNEVHGELQQNWG